MLGRLALSAREYTVPTAMEPEIAYAPRPPHTHRAVHFLGVYRSSLELGDFWCTSRQLKETVRSSSEGWWLRQTWWECYPAYWKGLEHTHRVLHIHAAFWAHTAHTPHVCVGNTQQAYPDCYLSEPRLLRVCGLAPSRLMCGNNELELCPTLPSKSRLFLSGT